MVVISSGKSNNNKRSIHPLSAGLIFISGFILGHLHSQFTSTAAVLSQNNDCLPSQVPLLQPLKSTTTSSSSSNSNYIHADDNNNGWHSIQVFYGNKTHLKQTLPSDQKWFSQAKQDEAVITLLKGKRNGFFVDLASNDATILSNTYSLEESYNWTGLCIEPNPIYWSNLTYRNCQVVAAVVGRNRMEQVYFRFNAGDHSGIAGDGFDNGAKFIKQSRPRFTVTLVEILQRFRAPKQIDYLSLDVEGAEEFIMKQFPLREYTISLLTVERPKESLRSLLEQHGYTFLKRLTRWGETLWAHSSVVQDLAMNELERFTPPPRQKKQQEQEGK